MANENWEYGDGEYWDDPSSRLTQEDILYGLHDQNTVDPIAQEMMWQAVVEGDNQAYDDFVEYMMNVYGIDIEDAWEWEDFAIWYDSQ